MSLNPYIFIGELHNEILDYVIAQNPTNPPEITQMADLISDYYAANYASTNNIIEKSKMYSFLMNSYNELNGLTYSELKSIAMYRNGGSPYARKFIDNTFIDYSSFTIETLIDFYGTLQHDIISNTDVTNEMKQFPFFCTAIGIKSAEYWKYQFDNNTNWYPFISASPKGAGLADFIASVLAFGIAEGMERRNLEPKAGDIILMGFFVALASTMGLHFLDIAL
jgi:hypothetical protein